MQELVNLLEPFFNSEKGNHRNDVYFIAKEWNEKKRLKVLEIGVNGKCLSYEPKDNEQTEVTK